MDKPSSSVWLSAIMLRFAHVWDDYVSPFGNDFADGVTLIKRVGVLQQPCITCLFVFHVVLIATLLICLIVVLFTYYIYSCKK